MGTHARFFAMRSMSTSNLRSAYGPAFNRKANVAKVLNGKPKIMAKPEIDTSKPSAISKYVPAALSWAGLGVTTAGALYMAQPLGWMGATLIGGSIAFPVAVLGTQLLFCGGGAGIAKAMGGFPAGQRIVRLAHEAADAVGVPAPAHVYEVPAKEPNAFAAGLTTSSRTVAVTSGLDSLLNEN